MAKQKFTPSYNRDWCLAEGTRNDMIRERNHRHKSYPVKPLPRVRQRLPEIAFSYYGFNAYYEYPVGYRVNLGTPKVFSTQKAAKDAIKYYLVHQGYHTGSSMRLVKPKSRR